MKKKRSIFSHILRVRVAGSCRGLVAMGISIVFLLPAPAPGAPGDPDRTFGGTGKKNGVR